jgi:hypothetical protein
MQCSGSIVLLLQTCQEQQQQQLADQLLEASCSGLRGSQEGWRVAGCRQLLLSLASTPTAQLAALTAAAEGAAAELRTTVFPMQYSNSIVYLCRECKEQEKLLEQLTEAVAYALRHTPGSWQTDGCRDILQALQATPAARLAVLSAAVNAAAAVLSDAAAHPVQYYARVLQLLQACEGQQQLKVKVIEGVCCGVRSSVDAWKSDFLMQLLQALQDTPEARLAVLTAAVQRAAAAVASASATILIEQRNDILQLVQLCQGQQQLIGKLVDAICSSIYNSTDSWQVSGLRQLLQALEAIPPAWLAVLTTAVEALFKSNNVPAGSLSFGVLLSKQTDESLLQLSQLLLSQPLLSTAYYTRFVAAAAARRDNYVLLKQLLLSQAVQAALERPEVQQLVACQVANLQRMAAVPPFTWHMQHAKMPGFPQVCGEEGGHRCYSWLVRAPSAC